MSPSPGSSSGVASSLDLAARTFDLLGSLVKASEPTSVLTHAAKDLIKWLARERIDEASFKRCAELARELAYPNQHGLIIRESIENANERLRGLNAPVSLVTSGSLGRMMVQDQDYCYLVSTVASLASYYGNQHITEIICSLIIDRTDAPPGIRQYKHYQIWRAPITAVMAKIVDSIFLNVINAGHQPPHIPPQLSHLHTHALGHWELPSLIRGVQKADGDVLIICGVFFADVFAWLYSHFHGHLAVSIHGTVSFTEELGPDQMSVHLMIQEVCNDTNECLQKKHVFEASVAAGDGTYRLFVGRSSTEGPFSESARPQPHVRQPLYHESATDTGRRYTQRAGKLNRSETNHVSAVAKCILKWLLALRLKPREIGLMFAPKWDGKGGVTCLSEMLSTHPSILHKDTGHLESAAPVFNRIQKQPNDGSDGGSSSDMGTGEAELYGLSAVISCFPIALDMLESISKRCSCSACERHLSLEECKSGCLRDLAVTELFILLAHAISEGFGAVDVSGLTKPDDVVGSMFELFYQLIFKELLQWSDWFSVVTIVTAGMPYRIFTESGPSFGGTQPVAMQNGAYVAIALLC
ncbi:hypothetical protein FPOAC2_03921 [Fusarium poae]|uniref:hypothetical protein n=1 Tax=Fusarium poae TaxID=36050 RepID=UPI001CEBA1A2|nr:hypothetical protein FPOAC1_003808 [Fusarium poae]KAG8677780.1 hypothetical protein FPOAC1_003808 [Fusarium poae]